MTDISKNAELQQSCIAAVKSRFFAQYWGQDYTYKNEYGKFKGNLSDENSIYHFKNHLKNNTPKLLLKTLSKITDRDAISLVYIFSGNIEFTESQLKDFKEDIIDIYQKKIDNFISSSNIRDIFNGFDFLRSKGYALPFMEYSVDDLVSFGWVQLL